jgi:hypothetical protein
MLSNPHRCLFDNVHSFEMQTEHLADVQQLFYNHTGFSQVESLAIRRNLSAGCWDLDAFFDALQRRTEILPLRELIVGYAAVPAYCNRLPVSTIQAHTIASLLSFAGIVALDISLHGTVDLDDFIFQELMATLPCLQILGLSDSTIPMASSTKLTLKAVLCIRGCPDLKELLVRVNALRSVTHSMQLVDIVPKHRLKSFCVWRSPAEDAPRISELLQTAFPNMGNLVYSYSENRETVYRPSEQRYLRCWKEVGRRCLK